LICIAISTIQPFGNSFFRVFCVFRGENLIMGNVLVLYDSKGGNTQQMAVHVAEGVQEVTNIELRVRSVDEAKIDDVLWADGIAVGSPTYVGLASWKMKKFWDDIAFKVWGKMDGKLGCAFSSSGGWGGGAELACMSSLIMMMNLGMLVFGVTDYVGEKFTLHHGVITARKPETDEEVAACRRIGKRLAQWVAYHIDGRKDQHPGPMKTRS
jgi:NAD(P)H dehydrogenase (quinone)